MNILILSHAFNMDGRAASQTITDKIPRLIHHGIKPFVVSAITGKKDPEIFHKQILPIGPNALRFDCRHWLRLKVGKGIIYKLFMLPLSLLLLPLSLIERILFGLQSQSSWAISAFLYSLFLIRFHNINAVYSTGGAYSAHLAGFLLKKTLGIKWIVEIHDPLVVSGKSNNNRDHCFQAYLEKKICQYADHVWWFTESALVKAKDRNPTLSSKGFYILPGAKPPQITTRYHKQKKMRFAHAGSLSNTRKLLPFLKGLYLCNIKNPDITDYIAIDIFGSDVDPESKKYIREKKIEHCIHLHGRVEYNRENQISGRDFVNIKLQEADCLLLLHGENELMCSEYIPSKVYEYFWSKRPILGLINNNSQLEFLITERGGFCTKYSDSEDIANVIEKIYNTWKNNQLFINETKPPISVDQAVDDIIKNCNLLCQTSTKRITLDNL